MLFNGSNSFIYPDVLQIIGLSLSLIILLYGCCLFLFSWAGAVFLLVGLIIFICQPLYVDLVLEDWPRFIAGYFSKVTKCFIVPMVWLCV